MYYWNSLPQDEDGMAEVNLSTILDLFDYCGIKLTEDDAQVRNVLYYFSVAAVRCVRMSSRVLLLISVMNKISSVHVTVFK